MQPVSAYSRCGTAKAARSSVPEGQLRQARLVHAPRPIGSISPDSAGNGFRIGIPFIWCSKNDLELQLTGGLLDGPVYRSIYKNLLGIALRDPDEYAAFNTGFIVYHDDVGDYSTNEPIMDGTANLTYLFVAMVGGR